jgi:hypothetical protein
MKKLLITCAAAYLSLGAFAGTSDAKLTCRSTNGQVLFSVDLKDMEGSSSEGQFTFGQLHLSAAPVQTVSDPANGIFTLHVDGSDNPNYAYGPVKLWALPASFQHAAARDGKNEVHGFAAKLYRGGSKTGTDKQGVTIDVICTLEYK